MKLVKLEGGRQMDDLDAARGVVFALCFAAVLYFVLGVFYFLIYG